MLFAEVYYLYTGWSDDIKNTAQIALKLTTKKTNKRHRVKIFILYLPDLAHSSDVSFISITISSFLDPFFP